MNKQTSRTRSASKSDTRPSLAGDTRPYRRLRYPLPPRTSHTNDGIWDKPAVLRSLAAGGWFASPTTRYKFDSPATATFAAQAQLFFDELLAAQYAGGLS